MACELVSVAASRGMTLVAHVGFSSLFLLCWSTAF